MLMVREGKTGLPNISVVVTTYNRAGYIRDALDSILNQTYQDYEIVVVDDGSTDSTLKILEPYMSKIRYFYQNNKGVAGAKNTGVKHASGRYVAFLDSDDLWLPEKLKTQVESIEKNARLAFTCSEAYVTDAVGKIVNHWKKGSNNKETFESLREENFIVTPTVLIKKDIFNREGGFDETLCNASDYDFWLRLSMKVPFSYIEAPLCRVRFHDGNNTKNIDGRVRSYEKILKKKEIWSTMPFFLKRARIAGIYREFAKGYASAGRYRMASLYNLKAVVQCPFAGCVRQGGSVTKYQALCAIFKMYYLIVRYFFKKTDSR